MLASMSVETSKEVENKRTRLHWQYEREKPYIPAGCLQRSRYINELELVLKTDRNWYNTPAERNLAPVHLIFQLNGPHFTTIHDEQCNIQILINGHCRMQHQEQTCCDRQLAALPYHINLHRQGETAVVCVQSFAP